MEHPQNSQESEYLVLHQEQVQGPFGANFIEAMIMAGVYPSSVQTQKTGTSTWIPFSQIAPSSGQSGVRDLPPRFGKAPFVFSPKPPAPLPGPLSRQPKRTTDSKKTKTGIVVALVAGIFALVFILDHRFATSPKKAQPDSAGTKYAPTSSRNTYPPPVVSTSPTSSVYSSPRPVFPAGDSKIYRNASGRTYCVSHAENLRLLAMQSALTQKEMNMDLRKQETRSLGDKIDLDRIHLDRTNQYAVDSFNRNVNRFNAMNETLKATVADYNRDVDAYNAELARVGTLIP